MDREKLNAYNDIIYNIDTIVQQNNKGETLPKAIFIGLSKGIIFLLVWWFFWF